MARGAHGACVCAAFVCAAALFAAACAGPPPAAPDQRAARLERMLRDECGACHGLTLKGGLGPSLRPEALAGRDPEELRRVILDGRPGTAMPPWRPFVDEEDARWLVERLLRGGERARGAGLGVRSRPAATRDGGVFVGKAGKGST